ncbi:hypothetical protein [Deinococcus sp. JMULE3]|uniref:hypothetical protein n=1 Tax=Deinococcus sp. JMULE3 TaxID=2518341 RepID=UPI001575C84B|nr:hypothetical protein [Deinococcus sp. JMULE3]NTY00526.1 hypothetical protein [Deinococcus sp. JMULE3]
MREGLGLAVLGGLDVPVSARLSPLLADALAGLGADRVDVAYVRSAAFRANVVQANRAAEIAESDGKLALIARALAGCALLRPSPTPDRFQALRIVEGLSAREMDALGEVFDLLDPIDPFADALPMRGSVPLGWSRLEFEGALAGLAGLGLLAREDRPGTLGDPERVWMLTPLSRGVATLCGFFGDAL